MWKIILLLVSLVVLGFQITALAADDSIYKGKTVSVFGIAVQGRYSSCGLFKCENGHKPWVGNCDDVTDRLKAAAAMGVLGVVLQGVAAVVHLLLLIRAAASSVPAALTNFMWAVHAAGAVFTLICWALLVDVYDAEHCTYSWSSYHDLTYGFGFLVVNTVAGAVLAFLCFKHYHTAAVNGPF